MYLGSMVKIVKPRTAWGFALLLAQILMALPGCGSDRPPREGTGEAGAVLALVGGTLLDPEAAGPSGGHRRPGRAPGLRGYRRTVCSAGRRSDR